VVELAERALLVLSTKLSRAESLADALDAPARLAREQHAAFSLLFPAEEHRYASPALFRLQKKAQEKLGLLERLARRAGTALPDDIESSAAFLRGISLASAVLPALRDSTTLRHRWHSFCLG